MVGCCRCLGGGGALAPGGRAGTPIPAPTSALRGAGVGGEITSGGLLVVAGTAMGTPKVSFRDRSVEVAQQSNMLGGSGVGGRAVRTMGLRGGAKASSGAAHFTDSRVNQSCSRTSSRVN